MHQQRGAKGTTTTVEAAEAGLTLIVVYSQTKEDRAVMPSAACYYWI
jgi:hypothetical protein